MASTNSIPAVPPLWTAKDPGVYEQEVSYVGQELADKAYPIKSFFDAGANVVFHSDYPVSPAMGVPNSIYIAADRSLPNAADGKDTQRNIAEGITREQALRAMTINVAYQFHQENRMGSIEFGKLANMTVFDCDFLHDDLGKVAKAKVVATIVDGEEVYKAESICFRDDRGKRTLSSRDRHLYHGTAFPARRDRHCSAAHHFEALPYVHQGSMRTGILIRREAGTVVLDSNHASGAGMPCADQDVQRAGIRVYAMLDGILHDGLKGQRRQTELHKLRVVFHEKHFIILCLLYGQICAGVFQLCGKGNEVPAGNSVEVLLQVAGEIHGDLPGLPRVLIAQAVNAHQGVVDEMRPHLQNHDVGTLTGDFLLLPHIFLDLIRQDDDIHREDADGDSQIKEREGGDEKMEEHGSCHRDQTDEEGAVVFSGQPLPPHDHAGQGNERHHE